MLIGKRYTRLYYYKIILITWMFVLLYRTSGRSWNLFEIYITIIIYITISVRKKIICAQISLFSLCRLTLIYNIEQIKFLFACVVQNTFVQSWSNYSPNLPLGKNFSPPLKPFTSLYIPPSLSSPRNSRVSHIYVRTQIRTFYDCTVSHVKKFAPRETKYHGSWWLE